MNDEFLSRIDEIVKDLMSIKNETKRGSNRMKYRKEAASLQRAIEALRYLKKRREKEIESDGFLLKSESLNESYDHQSEDHSDSTEGFGRDAIVDYFKRTRS